jgi:hypothetical protein
MPTGMGMGMKYEPNLAANNMTLHMVLKFPPQGIRNPNTGATMHTADLTFPDHDEWRHDVIDILDPRCIMQKSVASVFANTTMQSIRTMQS